MLRALYDWTIRMADHPRALWVLAVISFAWLIALVALVSSVLGGMLGYAIGAFAYDSIGRPILDTLGKDEAMTAFNMRFNDFGFWAVLTAGVTPFPYKVITIMSGWTAMPLGTFIATSILARSLRFFLLAGLLWKFGPPIRGFIERRLGLLTIAFVVLLFGGFYLTRYL
jgi:membrane protein YqaA with SNARE-associated domain